MRYSFQSKTRIYFIMDFVNGGCIYRDDLDKKPYTEEEVKFIAAQLVLAFNELHRKSIIHRDLKPENVLIYNDGYIVLADYGLAKIIDKENLATTMCGTSIYFAPELFSGEPQSYAVDWWCLGILVYELFFGKTPFGSSEYRIVNSRNFLKNELL
jgi:serine/threonine protein kinase